MSYNWFNREKLLKNTWGKYHSKGGKQKAAKYYTIYYMINEEVLQEDAKNGYRNFLSEKEKNKKINIKGKDTT